MLGYFLTLKKKEVIWLNLNVCNFVSIQKEQSRKQLVLKLHKLLLMDFWDILPVLQGEPVDLNIKLNTCFKYLTHFSSVSA